MSIQHENFIVPSQCMFAQHVVPHIRTPLFVLQPRVDSWQVSEELGTTQDQVDIVNWYGDLVTGLSVYITFFVYAVRYFNVHVFNQGHLENFGLDLICTKYSAPRTQSSYAHSIIS